MQHDKIDALIAEYRVNKARAEYLRIMSDSMEALYRDLCRNSIMYSISTTAAYGETARGKGGVPVSKVESLALTLADGELPPDLDSLRKEFEYMRRECDDRLRRVSLVDAWLSGLTGRERYVLQAHIIDGQIWRHVIEGYNTEFGEYCSRTSLKDTLSRAREKIYSIAS